MGLGKRRSGRGDFIPLAKWDARIGTFYLQDRVRNDRTGDWESEQRNITHGFAAIFDLANLQVGWVRFTNGPELAMVPVGRDHGEPPGDDYKEGVRLLMQMAGAHAETGPRELISTAVGFWGAMSDLHDAYVVGAPDHPGMLPVVEAVGVRELPGKSVSYAPVFKIVDWVPRPPGLPLAGIAKASGKAGKTEQSAARARPKVQDGFEDEIPF